MYYINRPQRPKASQKIICDFCNFTVGESQNYALIYGAGKAFRLHTKVEPPDCLRSFLKMNEENQK